MLKVAIAALVMAGAVWGCADGGSPADQMGTGGSGAATASGTGGGTGGAQATGGRVGTGGTGSAAGAPGAGGTSAAGTGGAQATGGQLGTGGVAGTAGGTPPTCESLGWNFGSASLCGGSMGGYECATCGDAASPQPARFQNCVSATAFQSASVVCIGAGTKCGSCQ